MSYGMVCICGGYVENHSDSQTYECYKNTKDRIATLEAQLAEVTRERDRLSSCMVQAGLQCFLRNGTPEDISKHMGRVASSWLVVEKERDSLRTALRQCAEAGDVMSMLFEAHWTVKDTDEGVHAAVENWKKALALPVVQSIWKGGEHESGL